MKKTGCNKIIFCFENLNTSTGFFDGRGKREGIGWNSFFNNKKENRWLMKQMLSTSKEMIYQGDDVILGNPKYTSQTCTKCEARDPKNRNGELFKCLNCGFEANVDVDIAPLNIAKSCLGIKFGII